MGRDVGFGFRYSGLGFWRLGVRVYELGHKVYDAGLSLIGAYVISTSEDFGDSSCKGYLYRLGFRVYYTLPCTPFFGYMFYVAYRVLSLKLVRCGTETETGGISES